MAADLAPEGPVESELADRAAAVWRLRRVVAYEAAVAHGTAGVLPPHPDQVAPAGTRDCRPPPPRLGYVRWVLPRNRAALADTRAAADLLAGAGRPGTDSRPVGWQVAEVITWSAGRLLGWPLVASPDPWSAVLAGVGPDPPDVGSAPWIVGLVHTVLGRAAESAGRPPARFRAEVRDRLITEVGELEALIGRREAGERELAGRMLADRARVAATAVYADDGVVTRVAKAEGHLTRELGRTLGLLDRFRASRAADPTPTRPVVGFVLPNGVGPGRLALAPGPVDVEPRAG